MSTTPSASAARRCSSALVWASSEGEAEGSQDPLDPSVRTSTVMWAPPAAHFARVAPAPNSASSGWAPTASTRRGGVRLVDDRSIPVR